MDKKKFNSLDRYDIEASIKAAQFTEAEVDAIWPEKHVAFEIY